MTHWDLHGLVKWFLTVGIIAVTVAQVMAPEWGLTITCVACALNTLWIWQP